MLIELRFKTPFRAVFGLEQMEVEVPVGSTIQDVVDILVERPGVMKKLTDLRLIRDGELMAFYAINKHVRGGIIVTSERVLEESDVLTILGSHIGG